MDDARVLPRSFETGGSPSGLCQFGIVPIRRERYSASNAEGWSGTASTTVRI
jgi:hypothetical protein